MFIEKGPIKVLKIVLAILCGGLLTSGCATQRQQKQVDKDIFVLQNRVLFLEDVLQKADPSAASQRIASNDNRMEQLAMDIQKLKGEMDVLRIGVATGQLPGTDADQEGSVAQTLGSIISRLEALELKQAEIYASIENYTSKKPGKETAKKDTKPAASKAVDFAQIKQAFAKNQFAMVSENAPKIQQSTKSKDREELLYLYAESLFKLGKLQDAALQYNSYVDKYPKSTRVPHAKMRMGDCFRHLGDNATARLYYMDLVQNHPKTSESQRAQERLNKN